MPSETLLEIHLKGTRVGRGIIVPSTIKLSKLHRVIQESMGWTDSHLHAFHTKHGTFEPRSDEDDFMSDSMDEAEFTLDQLVGMKGAKLSYVYDFGDSWDHELTVKAIIPCPTRRRRAECLLGEMACPPEDIGGVPGYLALCEAMTTGSAADKDSYCDTLGADFEPRAFDLVAVQKRLAELAV